MTHQRHVFFTTSPPRRRRAEDPASRRRPQLLLCWSLAIVLSAGLLQADEAADPTASTPASQDVVVVVGAPGTTEFGQMFATWAERWEQAATKGDASCTMIGPDESTARERLLEVLEQQIGITTTEPLWLVLIGHGTFDSRAARFNLRGPDLSAAELAAALQNAQRPLAIRKIVLR